MIVAGTGQGIRLLDAPETAQASLETEAISCLTAGPNGAGHVVAGSANGVFESADGGRTWDHVLAGHDVRSIAFAGDGTLYVGTNPTSIYRRKSGQSAFENLESIDGLPSRYSWAFPVAPHLPNIRGLAASHDDPHGIYAGVEVGGVIASNDGGDSWRELRVGLQPDIHALVSAPGQSDLLYTATGVGMYRSSNAGYSWESVCEGLHAVYTTPVGVHPEDSSIVLTAANTGRPRHWYHRPEGAMAVMYRSTDGADSWQPMMKGMPETLVGAIYQFVIDAKDGTAYAATGDGKVLAGPDAGERWEVLAEGLPPVTSVLTVSG